MGWASRSCGVRDRDINDGDTGLSTPRRRCARALHLLVWPFCGFCFVCSQPGRAVVVIYDTWHMAL